MDNPCIKCRTEISECIAGTCDKREVYLEYKEKEGKKKKYFWEDIESDFHKNFDEIKAKCISEYIKLNNNINNDFVKGIVYAFEFIKNYS